MAMELDIAYLALMPNVLEFGPTPAVNADYPVRGGGRVLVPNPQSTTVFVKIGDQSVTDGRRRTYGTYNPSYYFASISVRFRSWDGNPGIGTYLKLKIFGDYQYRNGNNGPNFQIAPFGTEWFYSWDRYPVLHALAVTLEQAYTENAATMNQELRQVIVGWENNPITRPQWATNEQGYVGILDFIQKNRPLIDVYQTAPGVEQSIRFVNEVAAYIYLQDFITTD